MIRNVGRIDLRNIAVDVMFIIREILAVGFLRPLVPLARENAVSARTFESFPHSADAGEQIYEGKIARSFSSAAHRKHLAQGRLDIFGAIRFAPFPASDRFGVNLEPFPDLALCHPLSYLGQECQGFGGETG